MKGLGDFPCIGVRDGLSRFFGDALNVDRSCRLKL
jgi:hypothetical protein